MRVKIFAGALLVTCLGSAQALASKCNQVADDHYALLFHGAVQDDREFVRQHYCPVTWDAKKGVWFGSASALKTCLRQPAAALTKSANATTASIDSDPDPRSAHFVFSIVNSTDAAAWRDFGKLVHVDLPSPKGAVPAAAGAVGSFLIFLGPHPNAHIAAASTVEQSAKLEAARRDLEAARLAHEQWVRLAVSSPREVPSSQLQSMRYQRMAAESRVAQLAELEGLGLRATRAAGGVGIESLAAALWPVAVTELVAWSIAYSINHTCLAKWFDERKKLLDTHFKNGGAISYSFRVNTGGMAADNYVEQTVLAHLKGEGAPAAFALVQDRRPLEIR